MEQLTNAALPLIRGFRGNILRNPFYVEAITSASQTPILQGFFNTVGNFSGDLAPVIRAYTVCGCLWYLHGLMPACMHFSPTNAAQCPFIPPFAVGTGKAAVRK